MKILIQVWSIEISVIIIKPAVFFCYNIIQDSSANLIKMHAPLSDLTMGDYDLLIIKYQLYVLSKTGQISIFIQKGMSLNDLIAIIVISFKNSVQEYMTASIQKKWITIQYNIIHALLKLFCHPPTPWAAQVQRKNVR